MMKLLSLLLSLLWMSLSSATIGVDEVAFGSLRMELRSIAISDSQELKDDLLSATELFLNEELQASFAETVSASSFSRVSMQVAGFTTDDNTDHFLALVDFEGSVFFNESPIPTSTYVEDMLQTAFQGMSRAQFILDLQKTSAPFLQKMTYLSVELNNQVIAVEDLTQSNSNSNGNVQMPVSKVDDKGFWTKANIIIIASTIGGISFICLVGLCLYLCYCSDAGCCCCDEEDEERQEVVPPKMKADLRVKTNQSGGTDPEDEYDEIGPSPIHSVLSQESSKFTYNPHNLYRPNSTVSGLSMESRTLPSHFSQIQVDSDPQIDMEAWASKNPNVVSSVTPAPFGHDISAIEATKDLSHIREASHEDSTPVTSRVNSSSASAKLTKDALKDLDSKVLNISWRKNEDAQKDDSFYSEESYGTSDGSDVISDLKNLSLLINQQRASYSNSTQTDLYGRRGNDE